ncbi:Quinoprotein glucose dehydrogenase [Methylobacterium cerastii]|uniref:Quinoprotein glucose dehydrogenase n=2 Tax=Methylobacterium cerastii TaxID=932741 RepID=A0ABQ4QN34_9HYPH|nr:Quinoprotein glucose dehydrogenase [Methylobacterium cerastii]
MAASGSAPESTLMKTKVAVPPSARTAVRDGPMAIWTRRAVASLLVLIGLGLAAGGAVLAWSGGSPYYLLTGIALLASGVLVWRRDQRGVPLFAAMLVWTTAWAVWEVGFDPWQLLPRLLAPFVLGLALLLPPVRSGGPRRLTGAWGWPAFAGALIFAVVAGGALHPEAPAEPILRRGVAERAPGTLPQPLAQITGEDWPSFGNDQGGTRFSPLTDLTPQNVGKLEVAWEAETGPDTPGPATALEATPIMVGDALYLCDGHNRVLALDAETGRERWRHDMSNGTPPSGKPCRGVAHYRVPNATGMCATRIIAASQTPELIALDAATGKPCTDFGKGGRVDLREGISTYPAGQYYVSSAPQIIRGKAVVGGGIPDGQFWGGPSGVIRAFDARTGELSWAFDPGHPDRIGAPPAGETYTPSSPNSWAPISADEALGLVYLPMGNATPDNFGGLRRPFDEEVSSAVIALDAETGRLRWRFQATHHDIWDYDTPSQPTLVDMPTANGVRPALIQPTKRGEIFVLDRETGQQIKPVTEVAAPQGDLGPGERLSPTQPASLDLPAFRGATLRESDMWGATPVDQMLCRILFRQSRYEGHLTPITLGKPVLIDPGSVGGVNWGSASIDVDRGIMVANWMRFPDRVELVTRKVANRRKLKLSDGQSPGGDADRPMLNTPYGAYGGLFMSPLGVPCTAPPWGLIAAVDLSSGRLLWSKPLGTARDTGPFNIPSMLPLTVGTPVSGGAVTTRGGLVFVGASMDRTFRALDAATGRELWQARLPGGGNATPMTYRSPVSGRQFVVVAAGGKPPLTISLGTKLVAYALPR